MTRRGIAAEDLLGVIRKYGIKAAEPFIEKAGRYRLVLPGIRRKVDVGEEWIKIIEKEIAARVECMNDSRIK